MSSLGAQRVLLDTNVLLDAVDSTRPQSDEACRVLRHCNGGEAMALVCPMSLKDAYYVLSRRFGADTARRAVGHLMGLVVVAPIGPEDCDVSLRSDEPDFEDGLIRACAELNDVDFILTRDASAFDHSTVRAVDCQKYLEIVGADGAAARARAFGR